jgi:hypothetical protein
MLAVLTSTHKAVLAMFACLLTMLTSMQDAVLATFVHVTFIAGCTWYTYGCSTFELRWVLACWAVIFMLLLCFNTVVVTPPCDNEHVTTNRRARYYPPYNDEHVLECIHTKIRRLLRFVPMAFFLHYRVTAGKMQKSISLEKSLLEQFAECGIVRIFTKPGYDDGLFLQSNQPLTSWTTYPPLWGFVDGPSPILLGVQYALCAVGWVVWTVFVVERERY